MAKKDWKVTPAKETRKWILEEDLQVICEAWENTEDEQVEVMESAIGALIMGRLAGYDVLRIVHSHRTLKKYEGLLGITFKDILLARTADSRRVNGIRYADKFKQFWKALAGGVAQEPNAKSIAAS